MQNRQPSQIHSLTRGPLSFSHLTPLPWQVYSMGLHSSLFTLSAMEIHQVGFLQWKFTKLDFCNGKPSFSTANFIYPFNQKLILISYNILNINFNFNLYFYSKIFIVGQLIFSRYQIVRL